jgi:4-hydroxy-3-polyprenylbenzoate decarboxylase
VPNLGSKLGIDATRKLRGETERAWSAPIVPDAEVAARMAALWESLSGSTQAAS